MSTTFRKKPIEVQAIQWTGDNLEAVRAFLGTAMPYNQPDAENVIWVETLEGMIGYTVGYWLIKGVEDERYGCKAEVFARTYEQVTGDEVETVTINGRCYEVGEWDHRGENGAGDTVFHLYAIPAAEQARETAR